METWNLEQVLKTKKKSFFVALCNEYSERNVQSLHKKSYDNPKKYQKWSVWCLSSRRVCTHSSWIACSFFLQNHILNWTWDNCKSEIRSLRITNSKLSWGKRRVEEEKLWSYASLGCVWNPNGKYQKLNQSWNHEWGRVRRQMSTPIPTSLKSIVSLEYVNPNNT